MMAARIAMNARIAIMMPATWPGRRGRVGSASAGLVAMGIAVEAVVVDEELDDVVVSDDEVEGVDDDEEDADDEGLDVVDVEVRVDCVDNGIEGPGVGNENDEGSGEGIGVA